MKYAPIVMFVYNRADHFRKTYDALAACKEAKESVLYIFSDGSKNEKALDAVNQVRAAARDIKNNGDFKSVEIIESPVNKGLAASVIAGVSSILKEYGKVIVVEDDCVASPEFLGFMNECLDYYESNKKIGAVTGYSPAIDFPKGYDQHIFAAYRSCSWSWGTWWDRWCDVDWELKDFNDFCKKPSLIKKLNSNGTDRFIRLYRQTKGNGSSWSVRFGAHLVKKDMLTVYPRFSYISNIGCDASGVHSQSDDAEKMTVDLKKAIKKPVIEDVQINADIQKAMKKHYSFGVISDIKKIAATSVIVLKGLLN